MAASPLSKDGSTKFASASRDFLLAAENSVGTWTVVNGIHLEHSLFPIDWGSLLSIYTFYINIYKYIYCSICIYIRVCIHTEKTYRKDLPVIILKQY